MAAAPDMPVDSIAARSGLIDKAQFPAVPTEPSRPSVECGRPIWSLINEAHFAIPATPATQTAIISLCTSNPAKLIGSPTARLPC
jgi:hypothetical protein